MFWTPRDSRPSLLFVSPVVPALTGNGLAMRAAHNVLAFATRFRVTLLVLPRYASPTGPRVAADIAAACDAVIELEPGATPKRPKWGALAGPFDVVHVFRLAAVPLAQPWLRTEQASLWLDLDDVESRIARANADASRRDGNAHRAGEEATRARELLAAERSAASRFDRLFVASHEDVPAVQALGPARASVLPNVVRLPEIAPRPPEPPFRLLFVGTLGYEPNVAGLRWFVSEVWPLVRATAGREIALDVVGGGWHPGLKTVKGADAVRVHGSVPEVYPWYAGAHAAIVPILSGGGTRIKALEAFAHARPVIGTTAGLAGIGVQNGIHALIADEPSDFASACVRIVCDEELGRKLAANARAYVEGAHGPERLARVIAELM